MSSAEAADAASVDGASSTASGKRRSLLRRVMSKPRFVSRRSLSKGRKPRSRDSIERTQSLSSPLSAASSPASASSAPTMIAHSKSMGPAFSHAASCGPEDHDHDDDDDIDNGSDNGDAQVTANGGGPAAVAGPNAPRSLDEPPFPLLRGPEMANEDILQPPHPAVLNQLKERVADVANPSMVNKLGGPSRCYERFMLARKGNLDAAEKMFRETAAFRAEHGLDDPDSEQTKQRLENFRKFRHFWAGAFMDFTTRDGSPVQYFRFKDIRPKELLKQVTEEEFGAFYVTWMEETLTIQNRCNSREYQQWLKDVAAAKCDDASTVAGPSDRAGDYKWKNFIEIHDLGGLGRTQLYMPGILMLSRVLKLGQGNYPENLRASFLCNVPWVFAGAWNIISRVLDPATREKITLSNKVPRDKLRQYLTDEQIDEVFAVDPSSQPV